MGSLRDRLPKLLALLALIVVTPLPVLVNHFQIATLDPDIWWHLRVGQWILQNHAVPHAGIFSQHAMDHTWVAYSWGFEVLSAALMRVFGLASIPLLLGIMRALIPFAVLAAVYRISRRFWSSWVLAVLVTLGVHLVMVARPVLFTILFFAIESGLIFEARRSRSIRPLYWLIPLFWIWSNIHIQFIYGIAILLLFLLCELAAPFASRWVQASDRILATPKQWSIVVGGSLLATLAGPYFLQIYGVIFRYAGNTAQYDQILELAAMGFRNTADYAVLLLLIAACFLLGKMGVDLFSGTLLLVTALVSFRSGRDVWFVGIAAACLIAESMPKNEAETPERPVLLQFVGTFFLGLLIVLGFMRSEGLGPQSIISAIDTAYPIGATQFVSEHQLQGPMYNSFNWGGFLIFNLREYPVSVDGRNDFYGPQNFARVQNTMNGIGYKNDPDFAKAGFVLMERGQPLARVLMSDPAFKLAYSDQLAVVFIRVAAQR